MVVSSPIFNNRTVSAKTSIFDSGIKNINETLIKQAKVKKEILDRKKLFNTQRKEREERLRMENQLEAAGLVIKPSGPVQMIQRSTKGFLERLLGFLAYLTAGWLLNNLPTWIAMGKEFIGRVKRMGQIIGGLLTNITNIFGAFGNLLNASYQNLIQFDLFDTSNRVKDAFSQLTTSVDGMGTELEEAIRLITTPLTEGMVTGEDAPPLGTEQTNEGAYESGEPLQGDSGGLPGAESPEMYRIAAALSTEGSGAQSTVDMMQVVVNRKASGKYGSSYTEILSRPNQFEGVEKKGVAGFKKIQTLQDASKWSGQSEATLLGIIKNIQDPSLQKSAAQYVGGAFEFRAAPQYYLEHGLVPGEMGPDGRFYGSGWRGGPGDNQFLKDPVRDKSRINPGGPASFSNLPKPIQSSAPQQSTPGTGQSFRPLPQGSFKDGERQRYLAPRDGGKRKHLGIDITESNWKPGSDPRIPVVAIRGGVVSSGYYKPGTKYDSGMMIDQDDGYSVRYLHMTPSVGVGQKVSAGQKIGRLVDLEDQTHLHIELFAGSKRLDPTNYIKTIERGETPTSIARQQSPTPAQSQPEPQIGSVNSEGKIYVDSKYGYQSRATVIAKGLLPSQDIKPQTSTPQQNLVNPPGALAPGQRPDIALTSEQLKIAQQTREQGKASGLTGEALEKSVAAAVMASSSTTQQTPAQISQSSTQAQQNQQLLQQITPDRRGQTIVVQQPSSPGSQGISYSPSGGSRMMPISIDEITLLNNFMKNKLLLDLAYL